MAKRFLSLRLQAFLFFFAVHLVLFVAAFGAVGVWLMHSFAALETEQADVAVRQTLGAVESEVQDLDTVTWDWAPWDDCVSFIQSGDPSFVSRNLPPETMQNLRLNVALFLNVRGDVLYSRFADFHTGKEMPMPKGLAAHIGQDGLLTRHTDNQGHISGALLLDGNTCLLVSSRPITMTNHEGQIYGTVIMGRLLGGFVVDRLEEKVQAPLSVLYSGDTAPAGAYGDVFSALVSEGGKHFLRTSSRQIDAFCLVPDLEGKNGVALHLDLPRKTYEKGQHLYRLFALAFVAVFLLIHVSTGLFLERRILSRIAQLLGTITRISTSEDASERVRITGRDEITRLAGGFNEMMDGLEGARHRLMEDDARLAAILDTAAEGIVTMDEEGRIISFNGAAEGIFGYTVGEVHGTSFAQLLAPPEGTAPERYLAQCLYLGGEKERHGREVPGRRKNGAAFPMSLSVSRLPINGGGTLLTGIVRDITDEKRHMAMLEFAATYDPLTRLLNRNQFEEHLARAMYSADRYHHTLSLVICDVNNFTGVNDKHGHAAGDEVLRVFAQTVREEIRANDFAGRCGGDELCLALLHATRAQAGLCIDRIREQLEAHEFSGAAGSRFKVTVSCGLVELPSAETTQEQFFAHAYRALYEAKAHGRDRDQTL